MIMRTRTIPNMMAESVSTSRSNGVAGVCIRTP
jgi:hypothetical protein